MTRVSVTNDAATVVVVEVVEVVEVDVVVVEALEDDGIGVVVGATPVSAVVDGFAPTDVASRLVCPPDTTDADVPDEHANIVTCDAASSALNHIRLVIGD